MGRMRIVALPRGKLGTNEGQCTGQVGHQAWATLVRMALKQSRDGMLIGPGPKPRGNHNIYSWWGHPGTLHLQSTRVLARAAQTRSHFAEWRKGMNEWEKRVASVLLAGLWRIGRVTPCHPRSSAAVISRQTVFYKKSQPNKVGWKNSETCFS